MLSTELIQYRTTKSSFLPALLQIQNISSTKHSKTQSTLTKTTQPQMDAHKPKKTQLHLLNSTFPFSLSDFLVLFFLPFIQSGALQTARLFPTSPTFARIVPHVLKSAEIQISVSITVRHHTKQTLLLSTSKNKMCSLIDFSKVYYT